MHTPTLVYIVALLVDVYTQSHNLFVGQPQHGDVMLHNSNQHKLGVPLRVTHGNMTYPESGHRIRGVEIHSIAVLDKEDDNTGGFASIAAGGIGQSFVKIDFKSHLGLGYDFDVVIYGGSN